MRLRARRPQHIDRRLREVTRSLFGGHDERATTVGDHAAVELVQRIGDQPRVDHVVDGDRVAVARQRVEGRVLAHTDRDLGELLGRGTELVHVTARRHGVAADERYAVRGHELRGTFDRRVAGDKTAGAEHATHTAELIRPVGHEDGVGDAVLDRRRRVLHVELERRSAGHRRVDVAVLDAEILGHHHGHISLTARGVDVAVEVGFGHAAIRQRSLHGQRVVLRAGEMRGDRVVGQRDPTDHRCASGHGRS